MHAALIAAPCTQPWVRSRIAVFRKTLRATGDDPPP